MIFAPSYRLIIAFSLLFSFFVEEAMAQYFPKRDFWKSHKVELILGMGTANYLGDLGGRNGDANDLKFLNVEPSQFKTNFQMGFKYNFAYRHAASINFSFLQVSGDDALTQNVLRNNRNLSFRSTISEVNGRYEFHIMRPKIGHFGRVKWADNQKFRLVNLYTFVGLGVFRFNPKAEYNGEWVALQPLGTEGQGLPGGPPELYSRFAISAPIGLGLSYYIGFKTKLGFEFSYRFTNTDYLDDVSGFYYDNDALRAARGDMAADLADRSDGENPDIWTIEGAIRGNPENDDNFFGLTFTLTTSLVNNKELVQKVKEKRKRKKRIKGSPVKF